MTRRTVARIVGITLLAGARVGCAEGALTGSVTGPGSSTSVLDMTWQSGLFGESGTLAATMPDDEQFKGTYQVIRAGTPRSALPAAWTAAARAPARLRGAPESPRSSRIGRFTP